MNRILTAEAPAPIGPYSQAVTEGGLVFLSGQIPLHPERVLQNLEAVLRASGTGWPGVLRVTVYLSRLEDAAAFNRVYERMLEGARPARSTVEVSALPMGVKLEIDVIASTRIR